MSACLCSPLQAFVRVCQFSEDVDFPCFKSIVTRLDMHFFRFSLPAYNNIAGPFVLLDAAQAWCAFSAGAPKKPNTIRYDEVDGLQVQRIQE